MGSIVGWNYFAQQLSRRQSLEKAQSIKNLTIF
jgi:hypothetical protein